MGVNKVVINTDTGEETIVDLTEDTVIPTMLAAGYTAHDASGEEIVGTLHVISKEDVTPIKGVDYFDGERGNSILSITTAPSSYTTATGGFTPVYRIALSTVLTQSTATKVLVGDTLKYNYYTYPVGYVDNSYVYLGTRVSIRGATGAAGATVNEVIAALPTIIITGVDANGSTHSWTVYSPNGASNEPTD